MNKKMWQCNTENTIDNLYSLEYFCMWILSESMDLPGNMQLLGIFIYSYSASNKDSYNFHAMDFQIVPSVIQY